MRVTVLCENTIGVTMPQGLVGEHGLSFLIEEDHSVLYDTGQGMGILNNLGLMGKNVNAIDKIIISHGHYDHTGGLMPVLKQRASGVPVYIHSDAFQNKIAYIETPDENFEIPIGFQHTKKDYEACGAEFRFIDHFTKIDEHIYAISDIERPKGWKTWDVRLKYKDGEAIYDDPFNDDLSLLLETGSGPVVLLGCAHAGVVEILNDLSAKTGHTEFHAVIGGTHLGSAPETYVNKAMETFKQYHVKVVGTSHCTGFHVSAKIMSQFKNEFVLANVGSVFDF
ncbi:MAG: MBL fold metallo-hydrolase [Desulfobacteraceae bacterium]|jgi:7,8-dihydropterin-6-yl-methyl-4-(beta-D-ribofuranosyl)aminobenzene 5'-phosphate synthase|nr:MBL fold metallo-hydrolase [Desulfobacteraceae bacterium]